MEPMTGLSAQALSRFRNQVLALDPGGDRWSDRPQREVREYLKNRSELEALVIDAAKRRRSIRVHFLDELGLLNVAGWRPEDGEPAVTVWSARREDPRVEISWGGDSPTVSHRELTGESWPLNGVPLSRLLAKNAARAVYDDLRREIEAELGCRLGSQSWGRPELVPAWAW